MSKTVHNTDEKHLLHQLQTPNSVPPSEYWQEAHLWLWHQPTSITSMPNYTGCNEMPTQSTGTSYKWHSPPFRQMTNDASSSSSMTTSPSEPQKPIHTMACSCVPFVNMNKKMYGTSGMCTQGMCCTIYWAKRQPDQNYATASATPMHFHSYLARTQHHCNDTPYWDVLQDVPNPLQTPIAQQTCLGWDQLYQGCTAKSDAINILHPRMTMSGDHVMIQILKHIWTYILLTWKTCNNHLHKNAAQLNLPNGHQAVITLYKQCHQLPPTVQSALYKQPMEAILNYPAPQL